jgi:hypothetical protein
MKPYFAKYFPVEGEIRDGNWYFWPIEAPNSAYQYKEEISADWKKNMGDIFKSLQKVQLFLCSRDLRAGDVVLTPFKWDERRVESILDEDKVYLVGCSEPILRNEMFKVIGPISPEAEWVKEGDEFEEPELWMLVIGNTVYWKFDPTWDFIKYPLNCVLIKGPCGHYH